MKYNNLADYEVQERVVKVKTRKPKVQEKWYPGYLRVRDRLLRNLYVELLTLIAFVKRIKLKIVILLNRHSSPHVIIVSKDKIRYFCYS